MNTDKKMTSTSITETQDKKGIKILNKYKKEIYIDSYEIKNLPLKEGFYLTIEQVKELEWKLQCSYSFTQSPESQCIEVKGQKYYFIEEKSIQTKRDKEDYPVPEYLQTFSLTPSGRDLFFLTDRGSIHVAGIVNYEKYRAGVRALEKGAGEYRVEGIGAIVLKRIKKSDMEVTLIDSEDAFLNCSTVLSLDELVFKDEIFLQGKVK